MTTTAWWLVIALGMGMVASFVAFAIVLLAAFDAVLRWRRRNTRNGGRPMDRLRRVLRFLRIVDENGDLSITNLAVYGSVLNLYFGPGTAEALAGAGETLGTLISQLGPLALALANYGHKRHTVTRNQLERTQVVNELLTALEAERQAAVARNAAGGSAR